MSVDVSQPPFVSAANLLLRQARDRFMERNGIRIEDYGAPTFSLKFGRFTVKLPNTQGRKSAVPLHDLHHVLTGYGTDWVGEAEIGAWELRAGCKFLAAYWLNGAAVVVGLFISPVRVWHAFRAAKGQKTLYRDSVRYDSLLQMTVGDVRERLRIPSG